MDKESENFVGANVSDKFQELWGSSPGPDLKTFLHGFPTLGNDELLQVVLIDQANRWKTGAGPSAEEYLDSFSGLSSDSSSIVDLAYGEYRARLETTNPLSPIALQERFPDLNEDLERQIELAKWLHEPLSSFGQVEESSIDLDATLNPSSASESTKVNDSDPSAPLSLDDFRLEKLLGSGAMGSVHLATQLSLQKPVAVKMLGAILQGDSGSTERFLKEARAVASLKHPHIVDVHGVGRCPDGGYFLVMDLLGGTDLERCIADGPLEIDNAVDIIEKVARAIDHAHSRGVVHRDLKPSNIMLSAGGQPIVTDFGLAKVADDPTISMPGEMIGTPKYMAPEQVDPSCGDVGPATDIFGLGGLLYALLIGQGPNAGQTISQVLTNLLMDTPVPRLRESRPDVPTTIEAICTKCLQKNPEDRFSSAREVEDALRAYREGRVDQVTPHAIVHDPTLRPAPIQFPASQPSLAQSSVNSSHNLTDSSLRDSSLTGQQFIQPEAIQLQNLLVPALVAAGAIIISLGSLVMAYYVTTTPAWSLRFDQLGNPQFPIGTGFAIDALRICLFVLLTIFICWYRLNEHFLTFMNPRIHTWRVFSFRMLFVAVAVFFGASEARRHLSLDRAPTAMYNWAAEHGFNSTPEAEAVPYRAFLLYSLVSYSFVLPSLVAIPFFAFSRGLKKLRMRGYKLLPANSMGLSDQGIISEFNNYERECERECSRYIDVLGIGALSIHFEYWIGNLTLTDGGLSVLRIGWLAVFTGVMILGWIAWLYSNAVCNTKDSLLNSQSLNPVNPANLSDQKNGLSFIKTVFLSGPGGLLLISLLIPWVHSFTVK